MSDDNKPDYTNGILLIGMLVGFFLQWKYRDRDDAETEHQPLSAFDKFFLAVAGIISIITMIVMAQDILPTTFVSLLQLIGAGTMFGLTVTFCIWLPALIIREIFNWIKSL